MLDTTGTQEVTSLKATHLPPTVDEAGSHLVLTCDGLCSFVLATRNSHVDTIWDCQIGSEAELRSLFGRELCSLQLPRRSAGEN